MAYGVGVNSWRGVKAVYVGAPLVAVSTCIQYRGPVNTPAEDSPYGSVLAMDPKTGQKKWQFNMANVTDSGILTTASDLLFTGGREGYFYALDDHNGKELWRASLGGQMAAGPMTYRVDGKQYVAVASGTSLFIFALRD